MLVPPVTGAAVSPRAHFSAFGGLVALVSEGGAPHCPTSRSSGSSGGTHAHEPTPVSHAHCRSHAGRVPLSSCGAVFVLLPSLLLVPTNLLFLCCFCLLLRSVLLSLFLLKSSVVVHLLRTPSLHLCFITFMSVTFVMHETALWDWTGLKKLVGTCTGCHCHF